MTNLCEFTLRVRGLQNNVEKFLRILWETDKRFKHFYNIIEVEVTDSLISKKNGLTTVEVKGTCIDSVFECMLFNGSYKESFNDNGTCLESITEELELTVEYYSNNIVYHRREHGLVYKGEVLINDCKLYRLLERDGKKLQDSQVARVCALTLEIVYRAMKEKGIAVTNDLINSLERVRSIDALEEVVYTNLYKCPQTTALLEVLESIRKEIELISLGEIQEDFLLQL